MSKPRPSQPPSPSSLADSPKRPLEEDADDPSEAPPPLLEDESLPLELRQGLAALRQGASPVADDDPGFEFLERKAAELDEAAEEQGEATAQQPLSEALRFGKDMLLASRAPQRDTAKGLNTLRRNAQERAADASAKAPLASPTGASDKAKKPWLMIPWG